MSIGKRLLQETANEKDCNAIKCGDARNTSRIIAGDGGIPITSGRNSSIKLHLMLAIKCLSLIAIHLLAFSSSAPQSSNHGALAASLQGGAGSGSSSAPDNKHPVYFSEYKLRSTIAATNGELRQLKREFMRDMTDIYLSIKTSPQVGTYVARRAFEEGREQSPASTVVTLMNEEFADMVIKRHIIHRRLVSGLKVVFVKMLPVRTLRRLVEKFKAYAWLQRETQIDVRPRFPDVRENHMVILYTLIELRARARAADDVSVMTADNVRRILQAAQFWLIESKHQHGAVSGPELDLMAKYASKILNYYLTKVHNARMEAMNAWQNRLNTAQLIVELAGGKEKLIAFIDNLIDVEGLDIDLNAEATRLDLPPTISEEMIANLENKWIPEFVLQSVGEDRDLLIENRHHIMNALIPEADKMDADLAQWADRAQMYLCSNRAVTWKY